MELIARYNISSGPKGSRKTIQAGQRFDSADYPEITEAEWKAMTANGTVRQPNDPSYASETAMQRAAAAAPVTEGRSPRSDLAAQQEAAAAREEEEDEEERAPTPPRRRARQEDDDI